MERGVFFLQQTSMASTFEINCRDRVFQLPAPRNLVLMKVILEKIANAGVQGLLSESVMVSFCFSSLYTITINLCTNYMYSAIKDAFYSIQGCCIVSLIVVL